MDYWTTEHQTAIMEYYYCTTTAQRSQIINTVLHRPLYEIARRAIHSLRMHPTDEKVSDVVIHLIYTTMPKLSEDKLQGSFQFLWVSACNYCKSYFCNKPVHDTVDIDTITSTSVHVEYVTDNTGPDMDERNQVRRRIMNEIDFRLKGQKIVNISNSVYLLLLKQYLLDNNYDCSGFAAYAMEAMRLKKGSFQTISARLGFKTMQFLEPIQGKCSFDEK